MPVAANIVPAPLAALRHSHCRTAAVDRLLRLHAANALQRRLHAQRGAALAAAAATTAAAPAPLRLVPPGGVLRDVGRHERGLLAGDDLQRWMREDGAR